MKIYLLGFLLCFCTTLFGTGPADYFRSRTPGPADWNTPGTWESSPNGLPGTWVTATLSPTSAANTISIQTGHIVTMTTSVNADQLVLEVGGGLRNEMTAGNTFTLNNGPGDDMLIQFGAFYRVNSTQAYSSHISIVSGAMIHIESGGTIEIGSSASGATTYASTSGTFDWDDGSIFSWATSSIPDIERTFFPDATSEIPIFRFTFPVSSMGGSAVTRINGRLESTVALGFSGSGFKYFRNGIKMITPSLTIDGSGSGKFIIDGTTAVLGGLAGNLITPIAGLDIGNGSGTLVSMITPLFTVTGNINLIAGNSVMELLDYGLTVTGTFQLTQKTSYVKTNGTGKLTMTGISSGFAGKLFPVGLSTINPLFINALGSHTYSARVVEPITPPIYNDQQAVLRTWIISSSTAPAATQIAFGYSWPGDTGPLYSNTGPAQIGVHIGGVWNVHESGLTPSAFILVPGTFIVTSTVNMPYFTTSSDYPFVIANNGAILSNDCMINAHSQKVSGRALISWDINSCAEVTGFSIERAVNGSRFETVATELPGSTLHYEWTDGMTAAGVNTYRIRVNRSNGPVKYSNTVAVINDSKGLLITSVSPNPLAETATITLSSGRAGTVNFRLVNNAGVIVRQWTASVADGSTTIPFSSYLLSKGIYYLRASGLGGFHSYRVVK